MRQVRIHPRWFPFSLLKDGFLFCSLETLKHRPQLSKRFQLATKKVRKIGSIFNVHQLFQKRRHAGRRSPSSVSGAEARAWRQRSLTATTSGVSSGTRAPSLCTTRAERLLFSKQRTNSQPRGCSSQSRGQIGSREAALHEVEDQYRAERLLFTKQRTNMELRGCSLRSRGPIGSREAALYEVEDQQGAQRLLFTKQRTNREPRSCSSRSRGPIRSREVVVPVVEDHPRRCQERSSFWPCVVSRMKTEEVLVFMDTEREEKNIAITVMAAGGGGGEWSQL